MEEHIVISADVNSKKLFHINISVFVAVFIFSFFYMKENVMFGMMLCILSLVFFFLFIIEYIVTGKTVVLSKNGCRFDLLGKKTFFTWNEMFVSYCENNPLHPGDTLCGPGLILSNKQIPQKIRTDALSYCFLHAPFSSVFVRFSFDGEDDLITFHRGGYSFKGHSANKETLYSFFELNGVLINECLYIGPKSDKKTD